MILVLLIWGARIFWAFIIYYFLGKRLLRIIQACFSDKLIIWSLQGTRKIAGVLLGVILLIVAIIASSLCFTKSTSTLNNSFASFEDTIMAIDESEE